MKRFIQKNLQRLLGFDNYLFVFSLFIINTMRFNKSEGDFLWFLKMIPDKGILLDIGANIGIMTSLMARRKKHASIHAFEPIPENLQALSRVLRFYRLKNVEVHKTALGDANGEVQMKMPIDQSVKMQGLSHVVHESIPDDSEGVSFTCTLNRLDDYWKHIMNRQKVEAIKMDVENFEYFVLKGAREMIQQCLPVIYTELWDTENRRKCIAFLDSFGYKPMVLEKMRLLDFSADRHTTQNFFFIPS